MEEHIWAALLRERAFQDAKYGLLSEKPHEIPTWIVIMRRELQEAEDAWLKLGDVEAMKELLQAVAVGIAAIQQHGVQERSPLEWKLLEVKDLNNA